MKITPEWLRKKTANEPDSDFEVRGGVMSFCKYCAHEPCRCAEASGSGKQTCTWKQDETYGYCETSCGNEFWINYDGPTNDNMKYCCYCGKKLEAE